MDLSRARQYDAEQVREVRVSSSGFDPASSFAGLGQMQAMLGGTPKLAFDYGARTVRFGGSLDEAEAKQIIQEVARRFPRLTGGEGFGP